MRPSISELQDQNFDILIVGGGINGSSAAQQLTAKGFSVLLVDKADFGSGASSKSSRLMHFGLRYLDRGEPLLNYFLNPLWFFKQCKRARNTMMHRSELIQSMPERMKPFPMHVPVYRDSFVKPWQMSFGMKLINRLGGKAKSVNWRKLSLQEIETTPFVSEARNRSDLLGVYSFEEYQIDWPERLVADYLCDARKMGLQSRNYAEVTNLQIQDDKTWKIHLDDNLVAGESAEVSARFVVNTAGPWIDKVLSNGPKKIRQQIKATKGTHVAVKLPEKYARHGFAHFNRKGYPFYILPWRDFHFIGPTETEWNGDPTIARGTESEIEEILEDTNYVLPGLDISKKDILYHWTGIRPMPHIPGYTGKQNLIPEFNHHDADGVKNIMSIPGGPLMVHRFTGRRIASEVEKKITPSGTASIPEYSGLHLTTNTNSPAANPAYPDTRLFHLKKMANEEQPASLIDLMFNRAGLGWTPGMSVENLETVAHAVAPEMGWGPTRIADEIQEYKSYINDHHLHLVQGQ